MDLISVKATMRSTWEHQNLISEAINIQTKAV